MSEAGIEHLSQLISPETRGIIWLTDEFLNYDSPGAYEINYLLNGAFTKTLANQEKGHESDSNFFLGDNFGKPFFVSHTKVSNKEDFNKVFKGLEVAMPFLFAGSQVFILNKSKNTSGINVLKELQKKRKDIEFDHLNI